MSSGLFDELKKNAESDFYPFHMPGHKRNRESGSLAEFYQYDITEIDGFDNLHQPSGMIFEAQKRAARLYHSDETYFLVNGSTAGILSAVFAMTEHVSKLIIARNCHKAVYHAAFLNRLEAYYVYPEFLEDYGMAGAITVKELEKVIQRILAEEGISEEQLPAVVGGVVITSPTYEGIVSDVEALARCCHHYGLPLLVDQAHGAHFGLHADFPESGVVQGADLVIHSTHKTLPAPTQTALLHRKGSLVSKESIQRYLRIFQSSSPSYLLMAGIDEAIRMAEQEGEKRLGELLMQRRNLMGKLATCRYIHICPYTEPGKLVISVKGANRTGQELYNQLREKYHLQMEMAAKSHVVAILTMMDTQAGFERLTRALLEIDQELSEKEDKKETADLNKNRKNIDAKAPMSLYEAYMAQRVNVALQEAAGEIAGEFINLYPPGIPLIVPGERIEPEFLEAIGEYLKKGYTLQGMEDGRIEVVNTVE